MSDQRSDALEAAKAWPGRWVVVRHGGNSGHKWRVVDHLNASEHGEIQARDLHRRIWEQMRQGGLALINPAQEMIAFQSAPRLRTRW